MVHFTRFTIQDQQPGAVPLLQRRLGDEFFGQVIPKITGFQSNILRFYKKPSYYTALPHQKQERTDSFWPHIADKDIKEYADEKGYPFVALSDLPSDQSTMAFGLFEHDGVAHHPSDKGMALIAKRIINCLDSNGVI